METNKQPGPRGAWEKHPMGGSHPAPPLLWELPFPIAHPAEAVFSQHTPDARILAILEAYRGLTRFLALLSLSQYLRSRAVWREGTDERLKKFLSENISEGDWKNILWTAAWTFLRARHRFVASPLLSFLFTSTGQRSERAEVFFKWIERRNARVHAEAGSDTRPVEEIADDWTKQFCNDLMSFDFLSGYELLQPIKIRGGVLETARRLRGPSINPPLMKDVNITLTMEGVEPEDSLILVNWHDSSQTLLSPFLHVGIAGDPLFVLQRLHQSGGGVSDAEYVSATGSPGGRFLSQFSDARARREDLRSLLGRFGAVGTPEMPTQLKERAFAGGAGPWEAIERLATAWVHAGYPYQAILELEDAVSLKEAIETTRIWNKPKSPEVEAFILLLALHYRLSWQFWAARNTQNEMAARQLLSMLDTANRHHRPRLRALYALQSFDKTLLERVLAEGTWNAKNVEILRTQVLTGKMKEYLRHVAGLSRPYPLPVRAEEVLSEVDPSGGGGIDLPLGPGK